MVRAAIVGLALAVALGGCDDKSNQIAAQQDEIDALRTKLSGIEQDNKGRDAKLQIVMGWIEGDDRKLDAPVADGSKRRVEDEMQQLENDRRINALEFDSNNP